MGTLDKNPEMKLLVQACEDILVDRLIKKQLKDFYASAEYKAWEQQIVGGGVDLAGLDGSKRWIVEGAHSLQKFRRVRMPQQGSFNPIVTPPPPQ